MRRTGVDANWMPRIAPRSTASRAARRRPRPGDASAHHLFTIVLEEDVDRDDFRRRLAERGLQTSVHYPPVHRFSMHAGDHRELPLTEAYGDRTVTLPMFAHMTDGQQQLVIEAVIAALRV